MPIFAPKRSASNLYKDLNSLKTAPKMISKSYIKQSQAIKIQVDSKMHPLQIMINDYYPIHLITCHV